MIYRMQDSAVSTVAGRQSDLVDCEDHECDEVNRCERVQLANRSFDIAIVVAR
jgi:hypothetical protein